MEVIMAYLEGNSRNQISYVSTSLDELISRDNPVRVIDAFIDSLDLKVHGFVVHSPHKPGQRPYRRSDLLKIIMYGYFNKIRSSRALEIETKRNLELMWLINQITPDHGTISLFLKENRKAFQSVTREFTLMLKGWGLVEGKLVAIDGTKIKAQNSRHKLITDNILKNKIKYIDDQIEKYMEQLESMVADENIINESLEEVKDKIENYKVNREKHVKQKENMKKNKITQICATDSESRYMKNNGKKEICYNLQSVVDSKNCFIVEYEVVNDINDLQQLSNMSQKTKRLLQEQDMVVVADTGYYSAVEIKKCVDYEIQLNIKKPTLNNITGRREYRKDKFKYDPKIDSYICPQGEVLAYFEKSSKNKMKYKRYKGDNCNSCPKKTLCTTAKNGRNIQRWEYEHILEEVDEYTLENNEEYRLRSQIVEHPFGTIKRTFGYTYFLSRGLEMVNAEAAFFCLAYNMKRLTNLLPVKEIVSRIREDNQKSNDSYLNLATLAHKFKFKLENERLWQSLDFKITYC